MQAAVQSKSHRVAADDRYLEAIFDLGDLPYLKPYLSCNRLHKSHGKEYNIYWLYVAFAVAVGSKDLGSVGCPRHKDH